MGEGLVFWENLCGATTEVSFQFLWSSPSRESTLGWGGDTYWLWLKCWDEAELLDVAWRAQIKPSHRGQVEGRARKSGFILPVLRCKPHGGEYKKGRSRQSSKEWTYLVVPPSCCCRYTHTTLLPIDMSIYNFIRIYYFPLGQIGSKICRILKLSCF